jgi:hypothetical protein
VFKICFNPRIFLASKHRSPKYSTPLRFSDYNFIYVGHFPVHATCSVDLVFLDSHFKEPIHVRGIVVCRLIYDDATISEHTASIGRTIDEYQIWKYLDDIGMAESR